MKEKIDTVCYNNETLAKAEPLLNSLMILNSF